MPKCHNDPTRYYRGNEPSPKGLGFCAHAARVGARKKGANGAWWVVREHATGAGKRVRSWKPARRKSPSTPSGCAGEKEVWGKNKPLERLWRKLASGDQVIGVLADGTQKVFRQPKTGAARVNAYKRLLQDPALKALITAASSSDCYERVYRKVGSTPPAQVLRNYTKYLSHHRKDKVWYLC